MSYKYLNSENKAFKGLVKKGDEFLVREKGWFKKSFTIKYMGMHTNGMDVFICEDIDFNAFYNDDSLHIGENISIRINSTYFSHQDSRVMINGLIESFTVFGVYENLNRGEI